MAEETTPDIRRELTNQSESVTRDLIAGVVVFLVAIPLCLGIALASGAPLVSGLLAGIIGGIVVGLLSGSHTSVSGPAAGLTAIVSVQIAQLGTFEAFLLAVFVGGLIQIGLGCARAGELSSFFPSSVIKGLLAAIGVILILKQIPHVFGHDSDPEGEMSFQQPDEGNTFSGIATLFTDDIHFGATLIGITSIVVLVLWGRSRFLNQSRVPAPLIVVVMGVVLNSIFSRLGGNLVVEGSHLVQIPVAESVAELRSFFTFPDFSQWLNPAIYLAGITIAVVASLETLLNLEAVDRLDPVKRDSPPSRELLAQGVGNVLSGLIGGLPVTSVIVRSSVNVSSGARTKASAIFHGILLLLSVGLFPVYLNMIPLASLAAILLVTGFRLASPQLFRQMWSEGRYQFIPFAATLLSIVLTDLLIGILIGLAISVLFILKSNLRRPIRRILETHIDGQVLHIELANQVSFLNRAALDKLFERAKSGSKVLIDATDTDYIDPDVLGLIRDFKTIRGPAHGVSVSLRGFKQKYDLHDDLEYADHTTRELQDRATPQQVVEILREGNRRFRTGHRLTRDFQRQVGATAKGQTPLAAVLSCIDSRVPTELVFDLGIGDIFSIRVAGNVIGSKSLASIEYAVGVAGVKLVLVLGHMHCGAVTSSVQLIGGNHDVEQKTGCQHLQKIVDEIAHCIDESEVASFDQRTAKEQEAYVDEVAKRNVLRTVQEISTRSRAVRQAIEAGRIMVVGAMYDVKSGYIEFLEEPSATRPLVTS